MQTSNGELTDNRLEEWKTARDVLTKIDERIHDLRKYGFSVVTTLLTISGFLSTTGTTPVGDQVRVAVTAAIMLLIVALRYMERNYQMFQRATAIRARILERSLNLELTDKISAWYSRGKLWHADLVYTFFAIAAFFVGLSATVSSLYRLSLAIPMLLTFLALLAMQQYLDLDKGYVDLSINRLRCNLGETVVFTLTNLSEDQPFQPGSVMFHVELRNGTLIEQFSWPSGDDIKKISSWKDNPMDHSLYLFLKSTWRRLKTKGYTGARCRAFISNPRTVLDAVVGFLQSNRQRRDAASEVRRRQRRARAVATTWGNSEDSERGLIWLEKMDKYVWPWSTIGFPPGMYAVMFYSQVGHEPYGPVVNEVALIPGGAITTSPLKFATITQAAPGIMNVVGAIVGKKIRVVGYAISLTAQGSLKFLNTGGADLSGAMSWGTGLSSYYGPQASGLETAAGSGLDITTTGGAARGHLTYVEV